MSRSSVILGLKILLPLAALAVFASLFLFNNARYSTAITFDGVDFSALQDGLKLQNPRFTGATNRGEPFSVAAAWALPDKPRPERVEMAEVTGEINLVDGRVVTLSATSGVLMPKANILELTDGARFESSDGYRITAQSARFEADAETLQATGGVEAEGPLGRITADRMRATRIPSEDAQGTKDAYIWFENRVKVHVKASSMARE